MAGGVQAGSLAAALLTRVGGDLTRAHLGRHAHWRESAFAALNTAFLADGAFVHVPADVTLERPLELVFLSTGRAASDGPVVSHPRSLIVVERAARAAVVETYAGLLGGAQHVDHHTVIDHAQPHCASHEFFNGVLAERAHGVFTGRIIVRPGAQRTDSKQTNNNLLLSTEARADSQPQLEIYADDVKCTHGSTVGPIDQMQLYYLRSRGLSPEAARSILTYGFGAEILDRMRHPDVRDRLDRLVRARLA